MKPTSRLTRCFPFLSDQRTGAAGRQFGAVLLLIGLGVAARLYFQELPNFAPVAALALFAGYVFRNAAVAALVPLGIMVITDRFIGGYEGRLMVLVYFALTAPVLLRGVLHRWFALSADEPLARLRSLTGLCGCSLGSSVFFFVVTNFGCWYWFSWYPQTLAGLTSCYLQALPFFRFTLAGDMFFAGLLFGGYALATHRGWVRQPVAAES